MFREQRTALAEGRFSPFLYQLHNPGFTRNTVVSTYRRGPWWRLIDVLKLRGATTSAGENTAFLPYSVASSEYHAQIFFSKFIITLCLKFTKSNSRYSCKLKGLLSILIDSETSMEWTWGSNVKLSRIGFLSKFISDIVTNSLQCTKWTFDIINKCLESPWSTVYHCKWCSSPRRRAEDSRTYREPPPLQTSPWVRVGHSSGPGLSWRQ